MRIICARWRQLPRSPEESGSSGEQVEAIALDTTGSSRDSRRQEHAAAERVLPVVRSSREGRSQRRLRKLRTERGLEAIRWCGGVIPANGDSRSCCIGCGITQISVRSSLRHSSIATWWRRRCAESAIRRRSSAASARWATNGCGMPRWAVAAGGISGRASIRCLRVFARSWMASTRRQIRLQGSFPQRGREELGLKAGIPIPVGAFDAHWDAIGAVPHSDMVNVVGTSTCIIGITDRSSLFRAFAELCREAFIRDVPELKRGFQRLAISSTRSLRARE